MTNPDVHALTGPYVLDALPDAERAGFEAHLAQCESCPTEVEELREAATKFAIQVAAPPPPALKAHVLATIEHVRQLPPLVPARTIGVVIAHRHGFGKRSILALAAAALAVALSGGIAVDQHRQSVASRQADDQIATVLADPDARTVRARVAGGGQAAVVASNGGDRAVVVLRGLRKLPSDKTWQLWLMDDSNIAHSIGLASGSADDLTRVINGGVTDKIAFGLTVEPAGGSATPTLPAAAMIAMT
ncbi:anti-sigma factor [Kribbella sp. NBC_01505]|uniref:anti-sigma factor n=1 Tax=Kribbella sp. NBC_01505 TaxID=2903580 RepID=UPI00387014B1